MAHIDFLIILFAIHLLLHLNILEKVLYLPDLWKHKANSNKQQMNKKSRWVTKFQLLLCPIHKFTRKIGYKGLFYCYTILKLFWPSSKVHSKPISLLHIEYPRIAYYFTVFICSIKLYTKWFCLIGWLNFCSSAWIRQLLLKVLIHSKPICQANNLQPRKISHGTEIIH